MEYDWDDFDRFSDLIEQYMPMKGEGETLASQLCTAVNKLIYKWFNDCDVFDNHARQGWLNDLSSYANWLYENFPESRDILIRVYDPMVPYTEILMDLAERLINPSVLYEMNRVKAVGSIYDCDGEFSFEYEDEEDDEDEWD